MVPDVPASDDGRGSRVHDRAEQLRERGHEAAEQVRERAREVAAEVKPKLRGWLHAGVTPLALAAGIVLIALSPTVETRVGSAVFAGTALLLFAVSAVYHRFYWGPRMTAVLRRIDHSNIFLLIAGSYTPFALILLPKPQSTALLAIVWTGAVLGVLFRVFWSHAPRLLYTPIYMALGWVAIFYADHLGSGGPAVTWLLVAGGVLYTLGGLVYGLKRPDPFPTWFGFHEVFHLLTIAAFVCHYVAASIATYSLR
ncbi:PAQR family membrane homeostasis protein TrhA [Nocardioides aequoreus]|uniref:PAQR family membrane homeostasis protein TrhA n=1 Tax=Nocardioides aequoreus TaxID=397278 RepID=UPI000A008AF0|nr:hemolysin III family protein [Nocardioides aequoreus]